MSKTIAEGNSQSMYVSQERLRGKPEIVHTTAEVVNVKILGEEKGTLMVQMQLRISGEFYTFVGPMVNMTEKKEDNSPKPMVVNLDTVGN